MALNFWSIGGVKLKNAPLVAKFQESAQLEGVGKTVAGQTVYQGKPRAEWSWPEHVIDDGMKQIIAQWTPSSVMQINLRRWKASAGDYVWETWSGYMQEPNIEIRGGRVGAGDCSYPLTSLTLRFHYLTFVG